MKKYLFLILTAILFSIKANANSKTVSPFDSVFVNFPTKVEFTYGNDYKVKVIAKDSIIYNMVDYQVIDKTLRFNKSNFNFIDGDIMKIIINTPIIPTLQTSNNYFLCEVNNKKEKIKA